MVYGLGSTWFMVYGLGSTWFMVYGLGSTWFSDVCPYLDTERRSA